MRVKCTPILAAVKAQLETSFYFRFALVRPESSHSLRFAEQGRVASDHGVNGREGGRSLPGSLSRHRLQVDGLLTMAKDGGALVRAGC